MIQLPIHPWSHSVGVRLGQLPRNSGRKTFVAVKIINTGMVYFARPERSLFPAQVRTHFVGCDGQAHDAHPQASWTALVIE
jgi:hypothetical protein